MTSRLALGLILVSMFRCVGYDAGIELAVEYQADWIEREGLVLDEARVSVVALELIECPRIAWSPFSVARAHAPIETEHTRTFDVVTQTEVDGGLMLPEPGSYCGVRLHLMPQPSRDAHTLLLAGEMHGEPFVAFSDDAVDIDIPCESPVSLDEASRTRAEILLEPSAWLQTRDLSVDFDPNSFRCRFVSTP